MKFFKLFSGSSRESKWSRSSIYSIWNLCVPVICSIFDDRPKQQKTKKPKKNNNETRTATVFELHNQTLHLLLFGWEESMITWIWLELRIWFYCAHTIIQNIHRLPGAMKMLRERESWSYYELKQSLIVCEQTSTLRCTTHNHFKGKNSISFCMLPPFIFPKSLLSPIILRTLSFRFFRLLL